MALVISDFQRLATGKLYHLVATPTISTGDATDLPSVLALAPAIRTAMVTHFASASAHATADATATAMLPSGAAIDLATLEPYMLGLVNAFNGHRGFTGHCCLDPNGVTDGLGDGFVLYSLPRAVAVLNRLKAAFNTHAANCAAST